MKNSYLYVVALVLCIQAWAGAQSFDVEEIMINGPKENRINLVFLGDGYQQQELDQYIVDVKRMVDETFIQLPFNVYKRYFNVYAIKVPSNVSGAAMDPNNLIDNYFGSSYGVSGIDRLLVPMRSQKVTEVIANNFPEYDQIFVVVNHSKYGGSGGQFATSSTNASAGEIAIHEIGHSFAGLADEYWFMAQEKDNQTSNNNPATIRWKNWLNIDGVGIYEHSAGGAGNYKPHQNCKMQFLGKPFCAVCKESFTWKIHELLSPVEGYEPQNDEVDATSEEIKFSLTLLAPDPNSLKIEWKLNNVIRQEKESEIILKHNDLKNGSNTFEASVLDTTFLTRRDNHAAKHTHFVKWTINKLPIGIFTEVKKFSIKLDLYPNPSTNVLNVKSEISSEANVVISIVNIMGKEVVRYNEGVLSAGSYVKRISLSELNMAPGYYVVKYLFDDTEVAQNFVHQ